MSGDVSIPGCGVGVSQQFIPAPQELCLIFRMKERLFLRAQLRALFFGLQLVSCVVRWMLECVRQSVIEKQFILADSFPYGH